MRELTALNLSSTGVSRVCRDWRENMPRLHELKLSNTNITRLSVSSHSVRIKRLIANELH